MIYFDNAATTRPCDESVKAVTDAMNVFFANPSSLHGLGLKAENLINEARDEIARSLSVERECIYFTSGATESNNLSLFGAAETVGRRKKRIVSTAVEHPSVSAPLDRLEQRGFEIVRVEPDKNGEITAKSVLNKCDKNTCLVTCQLVNNETGYILPVSEIFKSVKRIYPDIVTHSDCVQGYMKININAKKLGADLISLSGHKIYGPKGVGALYIKKGIRLMPHICGGGQERGLRSGTECVHNIAGFAAAVRTFRNNIPERYENMSALNDYLAQRLENIDGVTLNRLSCSSPYIASVTADGIKSETLLHYLEQKGIYVSSGSACSKGKKSGVLKAFGYDESAVDSTIRLSFSHDNTKEEIDRFSECIKEARNVLCRIK